MSEKRFNYGFNDFVIVECTPNMATSVTGNLEKDVSLPPKHPRAWMRKTEAPAQDMYGAQLQGWGNLFKGKIAPKHRAGYTTMAYVCV